jgi:PPOX class probable F420-dependent enzyme
MLTDDERQFLEGQKVARLATAGADACPHVVPICFAVLGNTLYLTIDEKPKRRSKAPLKRIANIRENPLVAVVADHYDDDWCQLGWVMVQGRAEVLESGAEHGRAQARLRDRYPQLAKMRIETLPVVAIRIERAISWGKLRPSHKE